MWPLDPDFYMPGCREGAVVVAQIQGKSPYSSRSSMYLFSPSWHSHQKTYIERSVSAPGVYPSMQ